ncbi:MAG: uroporphyrinogen-III C-methyltransferase [Planctomycetota bacterium]
MSEAVRRGRVCLVGAGPGDSGLITLRAVQRLREADLVVCDYLVNPRLLEYVRPSAEVVVLGHHAHNLSPWQIVELLISAARAGRTAVRLKGGDPGVFGRLAEETAALAAAKVSFEVVPGVTAASAAAAYAGIPITHSRSASAVTLVTGHQRRDKSPPLDYGALAGVPGTLVFYMGITSAADWTRALVDRGRPGNTPVAIIRRVSWPDQHVTRTSLAEVEATIKREQIKPPALIVVGEVVASMPDSNWFQLRPLWGQTIMVTRPRQEAAALCDLLEAMGAATLVQPAIEIVEPVDWEPVDAALGRLSSFDWLVFSSANGVRFLLDRMLREGDMRRLGSARIAAIGPGTADELAHYRLRADLVPAEYRAEALAESLSDGAQGKRFLLARASRGREALAERLRDAGAHVEQVVVYQSLDVAEPDPSVAESLRGGKIDWITVTSSAIARSLAHLFGDALRKSRLVSISPLTSGAIRELGFEPAAEAAEYSMAGVVEAILRGSGSGP